MTDVHFGGQVALANGLSKAYSLGQRYNNGRIQQPGDGQRSHDEDNSHQYNNPAQGGKSTLHIGQGIIVELFRLAGQCTNFPCNIIRKGHDAAALHNHIFGLKKHHHIFVGIKGIETFHHVAVHPKKGIHLVGNFLEQGYIFFLFPVFGQGQQPFLKLGPVLRMQIGQAHFVGRARLLVNKHPVADQHLTLGNHVIQIAQRLYGGAISLRYQIVQAGTAYQRSYRENGVQQHDHQDQAKSVQQFMAD